MRILYYFKEDATAMMQWQRVHIFDELAHHDCNIEVFNPLEFPSPEIANEKLVERCRDEHYDLFMTPYNENEVFSDTVKQIKHLSIPTMLICYDNLLVPYVHKNVAPLYDLVWLTSKETMPYFNKKKCNTIFLPYAASPYMQVKTPIEILGVGFVGTPYGSRINMVNLLTQNEIDVYLHCLSQTEGEPKQVKKPYMGMLKAATQMLVFEEGRKVIAGAIKNSVTGTNKLEENEHLKRELKVPIQEIYNAYAPYALVLSSTAARNTGVLKHPVDIVNLRSFEIPMARGIEFCRYFPEIGDYFEEDKEIIFYRSDDEMVEKAKYYLAPEREKVRCEIRLAARKRAEVEHTWFCRFSKAFDYLGLKC